MASISALSPSGDGQKQAEKSSDLNKSSHKHVALTSRKARAESMLKKPASSPANLAFKYLDQKSEEFKGNLTARIRRMN